MARPAKSCYICKAEDEAVARQAFLEKGLTINYSRGQRYQGGFIGIYEKKEEWLEEKVAVWTKDICKLWLGWQASTPK